MNTDLLFDIAGGIVMLAFAAVALLGSVLLCLGMINMIKDELKHKSLDKDRERAHDK